MRTRTATTARLTLFALAVCAFGTGCMAGADSGEGSGKERLPGFDKTKMEEQGTTFNGTSCGMTRWGIKTGTDGVTTSQMSFGPNGQALNATNGGGGWGYLTIGALNNYTNPYGNCEGSGPWGVPARGGFSDPARACATGTNAAYINGTSSCTSASQCVVSGGDIMVTNGDVTCEANPARGNAKYCRYWAENTQLKIQNVTMVQWETDDGDQDIHAIFSTNANTRCWAGTCWDQTVAAGHSCDGSLQVNQGANSPQCADAGAANACVRNGTSSPATYSCRVPLASGNTFIGEIADLTKCSYACPYATDDATSCVPGSASSIFSSASNSVRSYFQGAVTTSKPWPASTQSWQYGAYTVSIRGVLFGDFGHGANGSSEPAYELHPILGMCSGVDCMKDAANDTVMKAAVMEAMSGGSGVPTNGTFSASPWNSSWTTVSNTPSGAVASVAHSPDSALKLCAGLDNCTGEIKTATAVAIPSTASAPVLNYTTYITTAETSGTYDYLYARISSNGGSTWTNVATYSNANSSTGYVARSVSLTAYKGMSVLVAFKATSDSSLPTTFNVDDVTITGLDGASCTPTTCAAAGKNCGSLADGCGATLNCGSCTSPQTCGGGGTANVCGCTPTTCAAAGKNCGSLADGCGGTLNCGSCTSPQSCGGGGTANVCGCTPTTCAAAGKNCGSLADGCGGTLSCGSCTSPQTCGGGGTANVCGGSSCTPTTCAAAGKNCGSISDGCSGTLSCGSCTSPQTCGGGGTANVCGGSSAVLANGTFSASPWNTSWTTVSATPSTAVASVAHSPDNALNLCAGVDNCTAEIKTATAVAIPSTASAPVLNYTTYITTNETTTTTAYDKLIVRISSDGGSTWTDKATLSNLNNSTGYVARTIALDAYKGMSVLIAFKSTTDVSSTSAFNVDDVTITGLEAGSSCGSSSQLVLDTGIDGTTSWTVGTSGVVNTNATYPAHSAASKGWLCGNGNSTNNATQYMRQSVTIPSTACTASVSFWVRVTTSETTTTTKYDYMYAEVRNTSGTVLTTLKTLSNLDKTSTVNTGGTWVQYTYDLAAYKGQTIQLNFRGTEDTSAKTDFFVDDVTLNITQ